MSNQKKVLGEERRTLILELLKSSLEPITGADLASKTNVSRQVIVGDITLLKAKNEPIIATSQGYMYLSHNPLAAFERTVACHHSPDRTEEELNLLVDLGVTVKDVKIEHPVYGDLTASIMVSNRKEVQLFISKVNSTNASYLSELTDGTHLHTLSASSEKVLDEAVEALKKERFLIDVSF
ncbi:transcription repressor NadR [Cytobacillus spongiae]|jgi:transcriptional regulator of NAD metabolism|uniref:transcription repressor NadR n=1 Tax=Cytobacillus spongiae TaxID=2901381 RepID=UPI001F3B4734|nr:transcription repressor NadR [Cytobacillus spongiae]UII55026.1 transcription repressor NadR [Cytobacillus spongiae]